MFRLLSFMLSLIVSVSLQAQTNDEAQWAQKETRRIFGDEALQELYDYRMEIEAEAYSVTMNLCPIYHRAMLWDGSSKTPSSFTVSETSSLNTWGLIFYEGMAQPFSIIAGKKVNYLDRTHTGFFAWESWFRSLYVIFLLNSDGFKQGAKDCLGTDDSEELERMAQTIRIVDVLGTSGVYVVEFIAMEKLFSIILKSFRFVPPLYYKTLKKLKVHPTHAKRALFGTAGVSAIFLGAVVWDSYQEKKEQAERFQELIQSHLKDLIQEKDQENAKE